MSLHKIDGAKDSQVHSRRIGDREFLPFPSYFSYPRLRKQTYMPVIMGPNSSAPSLPQQRGAFRKLVRNNVHGIATGLLSRLQTNPQAVTNLWQKYGGEPNTLMNDIVFGSKQPAVAVSPNATISGCGCKGKIGLAPTAPPSPPPNIPSHYVGVGNAAWINASPAGTNPVNPPLNDNAAGQPTQNNMNSYIASYNAGQDSNGYYGWYSSNGGWWWGSDSDAEMRAAYSQLVKAGVPQGFTGGLTPNAGPLPAPKAKGADIRAASNSIFSTACGLANASQGIMADVAATSGEDVSSGQSASQSATNILTLTGQCPASTTTLPVDTSPNLPPPPPPVLPSSFPWLPVIGGVAVLTGLWLAFKD